MDRLATSDITKALKDSKQSGVGNASQCLALNISKGFCHKDGKKQFFVSDEGRTELG